MRQIVPRCCDSCGAAAQYESDIGVQFCYKCIRVSALFIAKLGMLESNPLNEILFDGVWRSMDSTYEVWYSSLRGEGSAQVWIERLVK